MGLGVVHSDRELFERERHCRHCLRVWLANRIMDLWQRVTRTCTEWTFVYSVIVMYYHLLKSPTPTFRAVTNFTDRYSAGFKLASGSNVDKL